jgi:hypothetical protein
VYFAIKNSTNGYDSINIHLLAVQILREICIIHLFDILKLLKYINVLTSELDFMLDTLISVLMFCFLLSLFIFIYRLIKVEVTHLTIITYFFFFCFSIIGMQFFGCKLCNDHGCDRVNFDSFPQAMISVFQVKKNLDKKDLTVFKKAY